MKRKLEEEDHDAKKVKKMESHQDVHDVFCSFFCVEGSTNVLNARQGFGNNNSLVFSENTQKKKDQVVCMLDMSISSDLLKEKNRSTGKDFKKVVFLVRFWLSKGNTSSSFKNMNLYLLSLFVATHYPKLYRSGWYFREPLLRIARHNSSWLNEAPPNILDSDFCFELLKRKFKNFDEDIENVSKLLNRLNDEQLFEMLKDEPNLLNDHTVRKLPHILVEKLILTKPEHKIQYLKFCDNVHLSQRCILEMMREGESYYFEISPIEFRKDKQFVLKAVSINASCYLYIDDSLKNDLEIAMKTVEQDGYMLEKMSDKLKNDPMIVRTAIKNAPFAICFVTSKEILNDVGMVKRAAKGDGMVLEYLPSSFRKNPNIMTTAARSNPASLSLIQDRKVKEYVLKNLKKSSGRSVYT